MRKLIQNINVFLYFFFISFEIFCDLQLRKNFAQAWEIYLEYLQIEIKQ